MGHAQVAVFAGGVVAVAAALGVLGCAGGAGSRARSAVGKPARAGVVAVATPAVAAVRSEPSGIAGGIVDEGIDAALGMPTGVGSRVWVAAEACSGGERAGHARVFGEASQAGAVVCRVQHRVGAGTHYLGLRIARVVSDAPSPGTELWHVTVTAPGGRTQYPILPSAADGTYRTHRVPFMTTTGGDVEIEVRWSGAPGVSLGWIELGRQPGPLVLDPPAGVLREDTVLRIEHESRPDTQLRLRCGDTDLGGALDALLAGGKARADDIADRRLVRAPLALLAAACTGSRREIVANLMPYGATGGGMVTVLEREAACDYRGSGPTRVLVTGFAPMTALGETQNASAMLAGELEPPPGTSVMTLVLPVEWESAAAWLLDAVSRCSPDVIVGFGEGPGSTVEVELEAYNRRDWAPVADNRGLIRVGEPIADGGAEVLRTRAPGDAIVRALRRARVPARTVAIYRPFICNEIFYELLHRVAAPTPIAFVHVPMATSGSALDRAERATVAFAVVTETVRSSTPASR